VTVRLPKQANGIYRTLEKWFSEEHYISTDNTTRSHFDTARFTWVIHSLVDVHRIGIIISLHYTTAVYPASTTSKARKPDKIRGPLQGQEQQEERKPDV
jgi:hypothetical protein